MALAADRPYETSGLTEKIRVLYLAGDIYYHGAIVVVNADGKAKVAGDVAGEGKLAGVVVKHTEPGASDAHGEIEIGKIWIPDAAAAQADVQEYCYATADDTIVVAAPANADICGKVVDVRVGVARLVDFRHGLTKTALVA